MEAMWLDGSEALVPSVFHDTEVVLIFFFLLKSFISSVGQASSSCLKYNKLGHFLKRWFKSFLLIFIHENKQLGH